ncbi:DNA gyrase subunit A [archaeon]|nr:DNA gyrase subunit A [archaeon]|tara:strand:+ start:360 stop:3062 length:2703 start_codon:yes stop_codon:yes gene_type:complete
MEEQNSHSLTPELIEDSAIEDSASDKIIPNLIQEEMKKAYLSYAMAVIIGRALPDVRDGLKPVHRRILYAMQDLGMYHNKPSKKCARIVGEVLGKYHPHGDTAVYDALVRMAQEFSLRYPLIKGQGNFGSVDGDNAAAMRYTEAKLSRLAEDMLKDLDKNTVDWKNNFDDSLKEPAVLPSKIPNLLMNGSSGIAVGMATNIPPHNLTELCTAIIAIINNPEIELDELIKIVPGPDFPTGADVYVGGSLIGAYSRGKGRVIIKSVATIDEEKRKIIISELPYQVNKATLIKQIADLVKDKKILGIKDINDESDRDGIRVVIDLKRDIDSNIILNQLYQFSNLKISFNLNMLALVDSQPKLLSLKTFLTEYIKHRKEIVTRRTQYELDEAEKRLHILDGLLIALKNLDQIIPAIRNSRTVEDAKNYLQGHFSLSVIQAKAILDLRLQKLASLEREKIATEHATLTALVETLRGILASEEKIYGIIKDEVSEVSDRYGSPRRSKIIFNEDDTLDIEDLIEEDTIVLTKTQGDYLKRISLDSYRTQGRGGKGVVATSMKDGDFVEDVFVCSTHVWLLLFTSKGKVHWIKAYHVPEGSRQSRGKHVSNLVEFDEGETIRALIPVASLEEGDVQGYVVMATAKGTIKKTELSAFSKPRRGGIRAIELLENDSLIGVKCSSGGDNIVLVTKSGLANRFSEVNVRPMGRTARGVRGIRLKETDKVVSVLIAKEDSEVLTITKKGYGKRSVVSDYRLCNRGGKGVINVKVTEKNGPVVEAKLVCGDEQLMLMSKEGIGIRISVNSVPTIGRSTQGVRVMRFKREDDVVAAVAIIRAEDIETNDVCGENLIEGNEQESENPEALESMELKETTEPSVIEPITNPEPTSEEITDNPIITEDDLSDDNDNEN